jgi:HAMP domain-containing protein
MELITRGLAGLRKRLQGGTAVAARTQDTPTVAPRRNFQPSAAERLDEAVLLNVLSEVKNGDFNVRMPLEWTGVAGKIADGLNDIIAANQSLGAELAKVSRVVGKEGKLSHRVALRGSDGVWSESIESVNGLIDDLVRPTIEMQRVIGAVASGDLSKKISADVHGEMLELKNTVNAMVDQLNGFISELTRVAREVGTEGKLGQAAAVTIEVGGVWKDLTDNVNLMAGNLTGQVRNIAEVTTAVANGDLSKKISADVKGEFLELKNTVNAMVDQLNRFASEVTRVAREVGVEGKLGGQAQSAEVAGVWKDLTDNVNQLAANLTNQGLGEGVGLDRVEHEPDALGELVKECLVGGAEAAERGQLHDGSDRSLEEDRQHDDVQRRELAKARVDPHVVAGDIGEKNALLLQRALAHEALAETEVVREVLALLVAVSGLVSKHRLVAFLEAGECVEDAVLRRHQRRQLREDHAGHRRQIALALEHAGEARQVGLQPVLLGVLARRLAQVADRLVELVLEHSDLAAGLHPDLPGEVSLGHRRRDVGDGPDLLKQSQSQAQELQSGQEELRGSYEESSRLAEQNIEVEHKRQEVELAQAPGRGEGRAAGGLGTVQVGVLLQHVSRAAHAAQQPVDPRP